MINLKGNPFYLDEAQETWVAETLASMSDDEKLEQLFCPLAFTNDPNALQGMLTKYRFGGLMMRPGDAQATQKGLNAVQAFARIPLFLAANLEDGGNGIAENEGTYMGRQMLIAATNDTQKAYELGRVCGREGSAVGINWAFAPVVDIDNNFRNPITNVRTYGSDAGKVLDMGLSYMKGANEEGVMVSIKHFPGDGVDDVDQHLATSVNSLSLTEWEDTYGKIYRGLISAGAQAVMVGHIAMPAMEEYFDQQACTKMIPATVSKNIVEGYLRGVLGFNGLIITDASPMVGLLSAIDRKTGVPATIANGCDMFLFTKDLDEDIQFMKEGYQEGIITKERLDAAVTRILATKASLGLPEQKVGGRLEKSRDDLDILQCEEHLDWTRECADMGVTLVKDTQKLLPVDSTRYPRVLLEILGDFPSNDRVYTQFENLLTKEGFQVEKYIPETFETIFNDARVDDFKQKYDLVIYIGNIENASNKTTARINWHTLFGAGNNIPWFVKEVPTMFISVGNPYHLYDVPMISTYINGYCHSPYVIEAVVEKIMGRSQFKGVSPVDAFCGKEYLKFS